MPANFSCNLSSINLSNYVIDPYTLKAQFNIKQLIEDMPYIVQAMDAIIDENAYNHPLQSQIEAVLNYRNIGIGVMGLADCLIKLGITYGSTKSLTFVDTVFNTLFRETVKNSALLAEKLGSFPKFNTKVYDSCIICNHFTNDEIEILKKKGLRNCSLLSIAPTGSIALLFNGVSSGVEPHFRLSYVRNTKSLHKDQEKSYEICVDTVNEAKALGINTTQEYFIESQQINWHNRIKLQAVMQKHIDTAISSTINLCKNISIEEVEQLYLYAWQQGLKGLTIDACRL